jgi:hypothetical protein
MRANLHPRAERGRFSRQSLIDRILEKIQAPAGGSRLDGFPFDEKPCWIWHGAMSKKRHDGRRPVISIGSKPCLVVGVLRINLSLLDGVPLSERDGYHACHAEGCDNPLCVNPFHAYWGTPEQNRRDRAVRQPHSFLRKDRRPC